VQVSVFANIYLLDSHVREICELIFYLLKDPQLEVRLAASDTLSGFIRCGFIPVEKELMDVAYNLTQSPDLLERHAGVLALSAVILAYPYTVPSFIPDFLMKFCRFSSEKQPIQVSVFYV
jgi:proteasome activator subunit 4